MQSAQLVAEVSEQEFDQMQSTAEDSQRAISHEQIEQFEHLHLHALLILCLLLVHLLVKDLAFKRVGEPHKVHEVLFNELLLLPVEKVSPAQNLDFTKTNDNLL